MSTVFIVSTEQIHDRNDGKDDLITSMRNRIENLEKELIAQKEKHTEHIQHLDQAWKQRNNEVTISLSYHRIVYPWLIVT